ncbi:hypothetical protein OAG82_02420 [Rubripirellula sp.]|nr:hypothetical protein [Rubripirellula sp.]
MAIQSMPPGIVDVPPRVLKAMQARVASLSRFSQLKNRFERTGNISRAIVVDIVETLVQLGRVWEAEAWTADHRSLLRLVLPYSALVFPHATISVGHTESLLAHGKERLQFFCCLSIFQASAPPHLLCATFHHIEGCSQAANGRQFLTLCE